MKEYDENEKYIMSLDANNLYGWATSQALQTGGFKSKNQKKIENLDLGGYSEGNEKGLILAVDL